jgi:predicted DNA-binding transcriptional regulator YafY
MSASESTNRAERLLLMQSLLLNQMGRKWRTREIAETFNISEDTAKRDLDYLSVTGKVPLNTTGSTANFLWEVIPESQATLPPLRLDYVQGAAMYAATRLLSQQQDERNDAVHAAIVNIIQILPEPLRPHLTLIARQLATQSGESDNRSGVFAALSQGWLMRRIVTLTYEPAHGPVYQCRFAPYLLEPSGIGYTIYFIGHSDPPGALRTYKLERIRHATLTDDPFTIATDFDGPALLNRAWGVMYGEGELAHVKLRFSTFVARRVRETRWHLSERVTDTADGLVWEADIGDITEIRPWIRGWGSDCEVLEPATLRDEMQAEVRRMARAYGIAFTANDSAGPDQTLLDDLLG